MSRTFFQLYPWGHGRISILSIS